MSVDAAARVMIDDLITRSAMLIDSMALDKWLDCFDDESKYMVIPRENRLHGYPAAIINCQTKAILQDRILVLHKSSKYNPHADRHILGRTQIDDSGEALVKCQTNFMIVQSTLEGFSKLFCSGIYEDTIAIGGGSAKFKEHVAVIDTFSVPNLIATPI